jgi:hypothetical protein
MPWGICRITAGEALRSALKFEIPGERISLAHNRDEKTILAGTAGRGAGAESLVRRR